MTCYHLELNGNVLNDHADIVDIKDLSNGVLLMVEDEYSEHDTRIHVNRLKEIFALSGRDNDSVFLEFKNNKDYCFDGFKSESCEEALLTEFYPKVKLDINCVKKLIYSGWNPPPHQRKLLGEYFYLDLETLEDESLNITAWAKGFFLNQNNTKFSPQMKDKKFSSHNLVDLLKLLSPRFNENFNFLISKYINPSAVETLSSCFPNYSWVGKSVIHSQDINRAENALKESNLVEFNINGHTREWNDEFQSCKDLPSDDANQRSNRDRSLFRVYCDFSESAVKGAIEIINGNVTPINPLEDKKTHMYIYNNIFYSFAMDGRDYYKDIGGDSAAHKSASNDLLGVSLYNKADVKGIYTLATVIVDYRGHRLVCQSIIPGLFSEKK